MRPGPMDADYAGQLERALIWVAVEESPPGPPRPPAPLGLLVIVEQPDQLLIENVAVDPDRQGEGIGAGIGEGLIDTDPGADPYAAAEAAELRREVAAALNELPFKYRAAVVLRHVMGLEYAEAARELDIPLNTFKSQLLRGTKLLREALLDRLELESAAEASAMSPVQIEHATLSGNGRRPGDLRVGSEQPLRR